jgi:hypothetical protein
MDTTFAFFNDATLASRVETLTLERPRFVPVTRRVWLASRETGRRLVPPAGEAAVRVSVSGELAAHVALAGGIVELDAATPGEPLDLGEAVSAATPIYLRVFPGLPEGEASIPLALAAIEERRA